MKNELIKEQGRFTATTFDKQIYEFIVYNNGSMKSEQLPTTKSIRRLIIKPNFEAILERNGHLQLNTYSVPKSSRKFVQEYNISDELLEYLYANQMVMYSTDMAYLYDLDKRYAYDIQYQKRAFKHKKDPEKQLIKQKQGYFD